MVGIAKKELRRAMADVLAAMSAKDRAQLSQRIVDKLIAMSSYQTAQVVAVYAALPQEVDTRGVVEHAWSVGKCLVFPDIKRDGALFRQADTWSDLYLHTRGMLAPLPHRAVVTIPTVDLFVVPGLAFDRQGYRLGRGWGFYDRVLAQLQAPQTAFGLAFSCQLVTRVPRSLWDVPLNGVLTDGEDIVH